MKYLNIENLHKFRRAIRNFGICYTLKFIWLKMNGNIPGQISFMTNYIKEHLSNVIEKYKNITVDLNDYDIPHKIWVCWWQGYENMPLVCKMCYERLIRLNKNSEIILLTRENYNDYVNLSSDIIRLFSEGKINLALFSDIMRNSLLANHGGIWVDATIWCKEEFDFSYMSKDVWWSIKNSTENVKKESLGHGITEGLWTGFLQAGVPNNIVNEFVLDCFTEYYKKYDMSLNYFLQNLFIRVGYECVDSIKNTIDSINESNEKVYLLHEQINDKYSKTKWEDITKDTQLFKLTYKINYNLADKENIFNYILKISSDE